MTVIWKTVAERDGFDFVMSDGTVDRFGDIVEPKGWDLSHFAANKNPIALFAHDSKFPIGTWTNLRVAAGKLIGTLKLAVRGTSARIDELISLVEQDILRAVSVGFAPIEVEPIKDGGTRFKRQQLLECSLCAVPANPSALAIAKSLNLSQETMSLAFGEHATAMRRDMSTTGKHAVTPRKTERPLAMTTLSQRIENAQNDLVIKRDKLVELTGVEEIDTDAVEELTVQIDGAERSLAALKAAEAKIGINAQSAGGIAVPATNRRPLGYPQSEVKGFDLLVRALTVRGIAHFGGKSIDKVLDDRYPGHEATAIITKSDQTIGTTTVSGWASELVQTVNQGFLEALMPYSIYPALRAKGIGVSFDGIGTVSLPSRTAGGAGGGFVAEGSPIRVGRITTAAVTMTPKKLGVIVPFSRELAKRSTPVIEALVRQAILEDTAVILDSALMDATASSSSRPAGLLNGVSAIAAAGGADYQAVIDDFKALLAPYVTANAADNITVLINPSQGLALDLMAGPGPSGALGDWFGKLRARFTLVESTTVPAGRIIALRNSDFATALGDAPEFDVSEQATVHMEDTTPLEIVSGTGPTTADPVRSFYQTATIGVRMLMDISWKMRRSGMVQYIDSVSW